LKPLEVVEKLATMAPQTARNQGEPELIRAGGLGAR
jgi:hypothetical protein